jgi:hypothetical protein
MDNTVGSLTSYQKSVIIGSLLGDGYVRTIPRRQDAFLEINHAFSQRAYVRWKHEVLKSITTSGPKARNGNGTRVAYRFYTRQHPYLSYLQNMFYRDGIKVVPENFTLDPLMLAVWYMDDGSRCRAQDVYLNTQQFDNKSQVRLLSALSRLQLHATLNKDKEYQRIRFLKSSIPRLHELVNEYIIPSMQYKLVGHDPVETTRRSPTVVFASSKNYGGMKI